MNAFRSDNHTKIKIKGSQYMRGGFEARFTKKYYLALIFPNVMEHKAKRLAVYAKKEE
jgi:hypothetical protein